MEKRDLLPGSVVQIQPSPVGNIFAGCFMQVETVHPWGVQGWIAIPYERGKMPHRASLRAEWAHIEFIGAAAWIA